MTHGLRVIAIDWSGALSGTRRKIWLCEVIDGRVARLECGRDRGEIETHLLAQAEHDERLVVGLDFAFSMPAWFLHERGFAAVHDLWAAVACGAGEAWLRGCDPPFWGRPGRRCPPTDPVRPGLRRCERGVGAKSVFQVGGAGAVGTGSLRGMPMLHRLNAAGFHVWPYDAPGFPLLIEIYPRILTGPVRKSSRDARAQYTAEHGAQLDAAVQQAAVESEDAFDALFSALAMWGHRGELATLPEAIVANTQLEGDIWRPRGDAPRP